MPAIGCGLTPLFFGGRPPKIPQVLRTCQKPKVPRHQKKMKGSKKDISSQPACNFILMMELRKKIIIFRDVIDLPPCSTAVSTDQLLLGTMKDLQKFYPGSIPHFRGSELKGLAFDKVLIYFCKALQDLGDTSDTSDELIDKHIYDKYKNGKRKNVDKLVEFAVAKLNGLIKIAREKFDMMDEDEENKDLGPKADTFGKVLKDSYLGNSSGCPSPVTPTSVLSEVMSSSPKSPYSSSLLFSLRVRAVGKLNPIDVKRLTLHMLPNVGLLLPSCLNQKKIGIDELKEEAKDNSSVKKASIVDETSEDPVSNSDNASGDRTADGSNKAPPEFSEHVASTPPPSPSVRQPPELSINMEVAAENSPSPPATAEVSSLPPSPQHAKFSIDMEADIGVLPPQPASSAEVSSPPPSPQHAELSTDMEADIGVLPPQPASSAEVSWPHPSPQLAKLSTDMETDIGLLPPPPASSAVVSWPPSQSQLTKLSTDMVIDIRSIQPPPPPPPPARPSFLRRNVVSGVPPLRPNVEAAQPTLVATEPQLPLPVSMPSLTSAAATGIPLPPPPLPPAPLKSNLVATRATVRPPPPAPLKSNVVATGAPRPPPPPAPLKSNVVATEAPVPPPPLVSLHSKVMATEAPLRPPPPMISGSVSGIPPPPMSPANGGSPSPPPPPAARSLRPKKAYTKLKRSTHMGTLYRILKGKVEGFPGQGKSPSGKTSGVLSSPSGKQGMADALAEMTKRSAYFQQIEGDVQKYAKSITELKTAISKFNAKDMTELLKFHKHVESILENLTDETQVLARFEGFPTKKLEALRTASALYSRLQSMIAELQNWKIESPLAQQLNKVERYFNKVQEEVDALERTKDEESKKFNSHNIDFDFQILVRIKEAMVDVSSNCMELALKERIEAKLANKQESKTNAEARKGCSKMLWRAFQLAFRIYTFSGGHDERADKLTRELAREIETDER